jgi:hypothetical protein
MKLRVDTGMQDAGPGREPIYSGRSTIEIVGDDGLVRHAATYDVRIPEDRSEFAGIMETVNSLMYSPDSIYDVVEMLLALPRMRRTGA